MYGGYGNYIKTSFVPDKDDYLIATFKITPNKNSLYYCAEAVAAESSIGTWTSLSTMQKRVLKNLQPKVFYIDKKSRIIKIAYPIELFEPSNPAQLLSDIAGNIFGMREVKWLALLDFEAPLNYFNSFPGPKFGKLGIRRLISTDKNPRPHIGTIIKPKVGLNPVEAAKVAYDSWVGGLDLVKDDENLTSHTFSKFEDRLAKILEAKDKAEQQTGKKKIYCPNISASAEIMLKRAELAQDMGSNCIMIDILTVGFSAVQFIRNQNFKMFIHAHRAMHAALTKNKNHGISMLVLAKLARMAGADQLHVGAIFGKMEGSKKEVLQIHKWLNSPVGNLAEVFSVASGGVSPLTLPKIAKAFGKDVVIQAGGGVHGHPSGTRAGAAALYQALQATLQNIPLEKYALEHKELKQALQKWH
ncbi:MAG: ribulose-bisphosphate carboxylase large subunit [Candidatus Micrarchaeota archaeon]|nr:ribulose-bisphosphate carboxylase large subunit [Candidatus Micrarchaeota archaeon]